MQPPDAVVQKLHVVAIVSQKGGAGKTTLAVHLADGARRLGLESVVFDMDPQGTAMVWAEWRLGLTPAPDGPEVVDCSTPRLLPRKIELARNIGARFVVIDTPPSGEAAARAACMAADLVIIPCRPQAFDLAAIQATAELVKSIGRPAYVVWCGGPPRAPVTYAAAGEIVASLELPIAPFMMPQRAAIHQASGSGRTVGDIPYAQTSPGALEVDLLCGWLVSTAWACGLSQ